MNPSTKFLLTLLAAFASQAQAATVVAWGSIDYVTANQNLVLPTAANNGTIRTWEYSATTAISPASNYTGPALYGAIQLDVTSGTQGLAQAQVVQQAAGDRITLGTNSVIGNMATLIFLKKADFSAGSSLLEEVSLDGSSTLAVNLNAFGGGSAIRAAVLNGGTWYLSNTTFTGTGLKSFNDLGGTNWGAWDPTGVPFSSPPVTFSVAGSTLTNIQSVGFWASNVRASANLMTLATDSISFNATVAAIPEPSAAAVTAAFGTLLLALVRRRR